MKLDKNSVAYCLSGGASKIAYHVGFCKGLDKLGVRPNAIVGNSAGALAAPLIALREFALLEQICTSTINSTIFELDPFNYKGDPQPLKMLKARMDRTNRAYGKSLNLLELIRTHYTPGMHNRLQTSGIKVGVTTVNLDLGNVEYFYAHEQDWYTFTLAIYASAAAPPMMTPVKIGDYYYADGGILENIPLKETISHRCKTIHAVILTNDFKPYRKRIGTAEEVVLRSIELMQQKLAKQCLDISSRYRHRKFHFHFTPHSLTPIPFRFRPHKMVQWMKLGYSEALKLNL